MRELITNETPDDDKKLRCGRSAEAGPCDMCVAIAREAFSDKLDERGVEQRDFTNDETVRIMEMKPRKYVSGCGMSARVLGRTAGASVKICDEKDSVA